MYGLTGKILRVNLKNKEISLLKTEDYKEWIGGFGIGQAIWFNLVKDKTISGFNPGNVLVIAPGLFAGTLVPAGCRMDILGIQVQSFPYEWFTSSSIGGRFSGMLKYAGYDAIVLEEESESPIWLNIIERDVEFKDAQDMWGLDTYETQKVIFREVLRGRRFGSWIKIMEGSRETTQRPAVLCIGPAGENKSRLACIVHDGGNAFGQGGFGAIWGAKKLKAISVLGTGDIRVADPKALLEARLWAKKNYATNYDDPKLIREWLGQLTSHFGGYAGATQWAPFDAYKRPTGCHGCHLNCRIRTSSGFSSEAKCGHAMLYKSWDISAHGKSTYLTGKSVDMAQRLGLNSNAIRKELPFIKALYDEGLLGRGKKIDTDLPLDKMGEVEFIEDFLNKVAYRKGIGDDLAEGFSRAALRWGILEEEEKRGFLTAQFWGYPIHYDARCEAYWGYASILSGRDVNSHDFNLPACRFGSDIMDGETPIISAEGIARIFSELPPYYDPKMMNFSNEGIYSLHMARSVAWLLHYGWFWKHACGLCDNAYADLINQNVPNKKGLTPEGEIKFYKAVTGENLSFEESMEIGRRIYNLSRAIWTLQGRIRDMERLTEYTYRVNSIGRQQETIGSRLPYYMPTIKNKKWDYRDVSCRHLDRDKVEELKTLFYNLEGWDPKTGWQTRETLKSLGLEFAAKELEVWGKL